MGDASRRLKIIKTLVTKDDIDELYGEDQITYDRVLTIAESDIPPEIDDLIESTFSESDVEFAGLDFPLKEVIRALVLTARITGTQIKRNVLTTKIEELIIRVPPAKVEAKTPEPSIIISCPECGEEISDDHRGECLACGWDAGEGNNN